MRYSKPNLIKFIERNIKVRDEIVKLYKYQKEFLNDYSDYRIVNKARQIGISWIVAMEALCYALINPDEVILIVSVSHNAAKDVMTYIDNAYEALPPHLKRKLIIDTKEEKRFDNKSRILSLPNNYRTVRGKPATRIYLDEYAHFGNEDAKMWESLMPSITRGGKATIISTPLGKVGKFFEFWEDAEKMGWKRHQIHYKQCPDIVSRIEVIKRGLPDEMSFKQEYCCEFVDESRSFFPWNLILSCIDDDLVNEIVKDKNPLYLGIDFGKKVDSTIIIGVKKFEDMMKVVYVKEFPAPCILKDASDFVKRNAKDWEASRIVIDQTGMGERMIEDFAELGSVVKGENFTASFKDKIISNLLIAMQDGKIKIPRHEKLMQQMHALRKIVTQMATRYAHPESGRVQHDDYVWALALAAWEGASTLPSGNPVYLDDKILARKDTSPRTWYGGANAY